MKSNTRSPGIRRATDEARRLGYSVHFVERVASARFPFVIPPAGLCDHGTRQIFVGTLDLGKPGSPPRCRRSIEAILRHELEHAGGAEHGTDYPEFGLYCGGTRQPMCAIADVRATKWIGHKGPFGRNWKWTHPLIVGLTIKHCGHPTALRPYYLTFAAECFLRPDEGDKLSPLFYKFARLRDAQEIVLKALEEAATP